MTAIEILVTIAGACVVLLLEHRLRVGPAPSKPAPADRRSAKWTLSTWLPTWFLPSCLLVPIFGGLYERMEDERDHAAAVQARQLEQQIERNREALKRLREADDKAFRHIAAMTELVDHVCRELGPDASDCPPVPAELELLRLEAREDR